MLSIEQCRTFMKIVLGEPVSAENLAQLKQHQPAALAGWLREHMIGALAFKSMETVWPELAAQLQAEAFIVSAENSVHFEALDSVLAAFAEANIDPVVLKGVALAANAYADRGQRPMVDIDLWLNGEQIAHAQRALRDIGYTSVDRDERPLALQELMQGELEFLHPQWQQGVVDLHWSPLHGWWFRHAARVDRAAMWMARRPLAVSAHPAWQLSPEHMLIHLSLHLAIQSAFIPHTNFRALFDIAHAVRADKIDWVELANDAHAWQVGPTVWHVLSILDHFVQVDGLEEALRMLRPRPWRRRLLYALVSPQSMLNSRDLSGSRLRFALTLSHIQHPVSLLRYLYRIVRPEPAWLTARYGADATWLHHVRTTLAGG